MHQDQSHPYLPCQVPDMSEPAFRFGDGRISGDCACALSLLSLLAVLSYRYSANLRAIYDAERLRSVLMIAMWASLWFSLLTFILARYRRLGAIGLLCILAAFALCAYKVQAGSVAPALLSLELDWLILILLGSLAIFTFLENVLPKYREQAILRPKWQLDSIYFCVNHLLIAVLLLIANHFMVTAFGWTQGSFLQAFMHGLSAAVQVLLLILCAYLVIYGFHRIYPVNRSLWRFHAVHTPLFDRVSNTYHMPAEHRPRAYGTTIRLPRSFLGQLIYPSKRRNKSAV